MSKQNVSDSSDTITLTRPFNINSQVKVKLTEFGVQVLKEKHAEVFGSLVEKGLTSYEFNLELDENGYYTSQMWELMNIFGQYLTDIHYPNREVFESTEILIPKNPKKMCF